MVSHIFQGGVPTEPDVKRLDVAFPSPETETEITHDQLEAILNLSRRSSRYRTVLQAWRRKLMRLKNLDTEAIPNRGYKILREYERVNVSAKNFRQGVRKVGRAVTRIERVNVAKLTQEEQRKAEHVQQQMSSTLAVARGTAKAVAITLGPTEHEPVAPYPVRREPTLPLPRRR